MYRWSVRRFVRFLYARAIGGDDRLLMRASSPEVEFNFPGDNSFAAHLTGREALAGWLSRLSAMNPTFVVRDVVVSGPPWNMTVAVLFRDAIGDDYTNEGVEWVRIKWGRVQSLDVFLDTERISAWEARQLSGSSSGH